MENCLHPYADVIDLKPINAGLCGGSRTEAAGAEFIQTQCMYNLDRFESWMAQVRDRGLHEEVHVLAGVTPMRSAGMAKYMRSKVPGMDVPREMVEGKEITGDRPYGLFCRQREM